MSSPKDPSGLVLSYDICLGNFLYLSQIIIVESSCFFFLDTLSSNQSILFASDTIKLGKHEI